MIHQMMEISKTIPSNLKTAIIITAAGSSTRMGGNCKKEFLPYKTGTVLSNSIKTFYRASKNQFLITDFIITIQQNNIDAAKNSILCDSEITAEMFKSIQFITGGSSRQESVFNGLKAIKPDNEKLVLIHDGARPFVSEKIITDIVESAYTDGASVPGITPSDTQKEIDENGYIIRHLVRKNLVSVQTPQGFRLTPLIEAHKICAAIIEKQNLENTSAKIEFTDDTEIWAHCYGKVKVVPGDVNNIKITYPSDLEKLK